MRIRRGDTASQATVGRGVGAFWFFAATAGFLIFQPEVARAAFIAAEYTYSAGGSGTFDMGQAFAYFAVCTDEVFPGNCDGFSDPISFPVFDDISVTEADIGRTFFVFVDENAVAAGAAGLLTNGIDDNVDVGLDRVGAGPSLGFKESAWLAGTPYSMNGVDLAGNPIQKFGMRLDALTTDGSSWSGAVTAQVFIPEPSTALLFSVGLAGLAATKRRSP